MRIRKEHPDLSITTSTRVKKVWGGDPNQKVQVVTKMDER